jgi:hypothetical protein
MSIIGLQCRTVNREVKAMAAVEAVRTVAVPFSSSISPSRFLNHCFCSDTHANLTPRPPPSPSDTSP